MKVRTLVNSLKESLKNIIRHPLVTVASISTVALMLTLLGSFTVVSLNANHMISAIATKPAVSIWVNPQSTDQERQDLEAFINSYPGLIASERLTPQENFDHLVKELGKDSGSLEGFNPQLLPYTYNVRLKDSSQSTDFRKRAEAFSGVDQVNYEQRLVEKLNTIVRSMNIASIVAFIVMCVVTLFIISNMVRISVFSRAEEISIMKYVGATNAYIRLPYVMEGALSGIFGSLVAWLIVRLSYNSLYHKLIAGSGASMLGLKDSELLLPLLPVSLSVLGVCLVLGIVIGSVGSGLSVRKHIRG